MSINERWEEMGKRRGAASALLLYMLRRMRHSALECFFSHAFLALRVRNVDDSSEPRRRRNPNGMTSLDTRASNTRHAPVRKTRYVEISERISVSLRGRFEVEINTQHSQWTSLSESLTFAPGK